MYKPLHTHIGCSEVRRFEISSTRKGRTTVSVSAHILFSILFCGRCSCGELFCRACVGFGYAAISGILPAIYAVGFRRYRPDFCSNNCSIHSLSIVGCIAGFFFYRNDLDPGFISFVRFFCIVFCFLFFRDIREQRHLAGIGRIRNPVRRYVALLSDAGRSGMGKCSKLGGVVLWERTAHLCSHIRA